MKLNQHLKQWKQVVSYRFPHLSLPQVSGLAAWSFGMVMARSSSLTQVSALIAQINHEAENTARQRLREWYKEGAAKAKIGNKRASLELAPCFPALLKWTIDLLGTTNRELALALDATNIGQNFTVLSLHVLYRGCGVPVAWKIVKATASGSWKPYWIELLSSVKEIVPSDWKVIVSADRGLYAHWLYTEIVSLGWHPFLRINHQGQYQRRGCSSWLPLATVVSAPGQHWSGQVTCFPSNPLDCTLLARWDEGYSDPWLILTDLLPNGADISWYGFRAWIECSYRDLKSDGWQWHHTRLRNPERAERHWLAMSVALIWILTLGGGGSTLSEDRETSNAISAPSASSNLSCFLNGLLTVVARLLNGQSLTIGTLFPFHLNHFSPPFAPNSS